MTVTLRRRLFISLLITAVFCLLYSAHNRVAVSVVHLPLSKRAVVSTVEEPKERTLGFDAIYIVYLPDQLERVRKMRALVKFHNLAVIWWPAQTPTSHLTRLYLKSNQASKLRAD